MQNQQWSIHESHPSEIVWNALVGKANCQIETNEIRKQREFFSGLTEGLCL